MDDAPIRPPPKSTVPGMAAAAAGAVLFGGAIGYGLRKYVAQRIFKTLKSVVVPISGGQLDLAKSDETFANPLVKSYAQNTQVKENELAVATKVGRG